MESKGFLGKETILDIRRYYCGRKEHCSSLEKMWINKKILDLFENFKLLYSPNSSL